MCLSEETRAEEEASWKSGTRVFLVLAEEET